MTDKYKYKTIKSPIKQHRDMIVWARTNSGWQLHGESTWDGEFFITTFKRLKNNDY